jgi:hypothetical protein
LAKSTIDTFCHINVIPVESRVVRMDEMGAQEEKKTRSKGTMINLSPSSPAASIFSLLSLDGDCLCRTNLETNQAS